MVLRTVILVLAAGAVWPQAAESLSCYSCSGDECVYVAELGIRIVCNGVQDERCYTKFNGYVATERGCYSDLTAANPCAEGSCETCTSDYCNVLSESRHKCVICSSVLDETCISNPGGLAAQQCGAPSMDVTEAQCFSRVIGSVTERGCVQSQNDLDACDGAQCATCATEGCNNAEYPQGRQKCVKCSSAECNTNAVTSYCDLPGDSCVTAQKTDGTYLKTCEQSMTDADRQFCQSNPSACSFCGKYECNQNEINLAATGRQCYTCQGTDCLHSSLQIATCHETDDQCFTIFDGFNPAGRGCRSALTTQEKATCDDAANVDCNLCEDDLCNVGGRTDHQCLYCSSTLDANCVSPAAQTPAVQCPAPTTEVTDAAQCYARIIGTVTERGCLGSATDAELCDPEENCGTCAGQGCNTGLYPTDRRKCVVGSTADQYCPDPWDDCVQIASSTSGGTSVKKCESSMTAQEVTFCQANSNKCDFCASDNCNQAEVEFNYVECMYCSSQDNPACATNPSAITDVTECASCVNILTNNSVGVQVLQRGCLEELSPEDVEQCMYHNSTTSDAVCTTCSGNLCNIGSYPADRLACYSCEGGSCFSHDTVKLEYCPKYQQGDSCFVQVDSTGMLTRMGCRSSLSASDQTNCSASGERCRTCDSAGCNDPMKYGSSGSCVQCDSALDVGCVGRAASMDAEPCNNPTNTQCYTRLVGGSTTVRGCLSDLDTTELNRCNAGQNCSTCSGNRCNTGNYPVDRLACYSCEGGSCFSHDTVKLEYCPKYQQGDSCFAQVDSTGMLTRMGCRSSLSASDQATCSANGERCQTCNSAACNDPMKYGNSGSCVQCDSALDVGCVGRASSMDAEPCNNPMNTHCYTRLVGGSTIVRGCLSDLDTTELNRCNTGQDCSTCSSTVRKCNVNIYPANRLECYTCLRPPCLSHSTISLDYCPKYSTTDRCVMLLDASNIPIRLGCNSTLSTAEQNSCRTNPQQCRHGSTSKSNDPATLLGSGKCVQCSSASDAACMRDASTLEATPCNDPLNDQCFSRFITGNTTERGCFNDLDTASRSQCRLRNNCILCTSRTANCNSGQYPLDLIRCHQCDSTQNATCKAAQSGTAPACPTYNSANHCYIVVRSNGDTVRKCSSQPRATECAGASRCEVCSFSNCNGRVSTAVMSNTDGGAGTTASPPVTAKPGRAATVGANLMVAITMMIALAVARHL